MYVLGRLSFFTSFVLYACTHTDSSVAAHSRCGGTEPGCKSLCCGEVTGRRISSRASASISGEPTWITSTSYRFAEASATVRCSTFEVPARHTVTLIPYFASKGLMRVGRSFSAIVV